MASFVGRNLNVFRGIERISDMRMMDLLFILHQRFSHSVHFRSVLKCTYICACD